MPKKNLRILIVAGEASGDLHAAKLVRALNDAAVDQDIEFFGAAGPQMRDAGVDAVVPSDQLSIVGLVEIGRALPMFLWAFRKLKQAVQARRPVAAILVDFPDFNLKLARSFKRSGIKVIYYISPQLWAWRGYRLHTIRKYVDLLITILPFEEDWYRSRGVDHVTYVGSPLATEVFSHLTIREFSERHGIEPDKPLIALLPGSRNKEIARILPLMINAASLMKITYPGVQFIIASSGAANTEKIASIAGEKWKTVTGATYDLLKVASAAAIASGTATLEAAIIGVPMAIVYKTSALNYSLLRPLISVEHFGLANLIAGERVAKEMIQQDFTAEALAAELTRLLEPDVNAAMREKLRETADKLGHGGASKRAAEAILKLLR
jgi:lipid-A-disaccharide synthase